MSRVRVYILLTSKIKLHRVTTLAKREAYLKRLKFKLYREKNDENKRDTVQPMLVFIIVWIFSAIYFARQASGLCEIVEACECSFFP